MIDPTEQTLEKDLDIPEVVLPPYPANNFPFAVPKGAFGEGRVEKVCYAIGEDVESNYVMFEYDYDGVKYENASCYTGILVDLKIVPGGPVPVAGAVEFTLIAPEHPNFEKTFGPPLPDLAKLFALDPPNAELPQPAASVPSPNGAGSLLKSAVKLFAKPDPIADGHAAAAHIRAAMPAFLEHVRTSCLIQTPAEAGILAFMYGSNDKANVIGQLVEVVKTGINSLLQTLDWQVGEVNVHRREAHGTAIAAAHMVEAAMRNDTFDWRRSPPFLSALRGELWKRLRAANKTKAANASLNDLICEAEYWPYIPKDVRAHYADAIARNRILTRRLEKGIELEQIMAQLPGALNAHDLQTPPDAWAPELFLEAVLTTIIAANLADWLNAPIEFNGEMFDCFGAAWTSMVQRATLAQFFQSGGMWQEWTPKTFIDAVHTNCNVASGILGFTGSSNPGQRRIDGTGYDDALEMDDVEYARWGALRAALTGLLCEWKANEYPRKQAEIRKRLATAKTVGEAEITKLDMAAHEEVLSYIGYALTAYARADRERARYYQHLRDEEESAAEEEHAAWMADFEARQEADRQHWEQFWHENREETRHREVVGALNAIKVAGVVTAVGTVLEVLKKRS